MSDIQLKMAKASKDDIQKTIEFFRFIEEFMEYGTHTPENEDVEEDSIDLTDEKFVEMLRKMWGGRFKPVGVDCMWSRVVFGCDMLINNCCDPESDCIELRKDWEKAIAPPEGIDEVIESLRGNKDDFRKLLSDRTEILARICDIVEQKSVFRRVAPWTVMKDITGHGSGVSSAIFELYRRKPLSVDSSN